MAKLVTYKSSDKGCLSARFTSGPAVKVGSRVIWLRQDNNQRKDGKN